MQERPRSLLEIANNPSIVYANVYNDSIQSQRMPSYAYDKSNALTSTLAFYESEDVLQCGDSLPTQPPLIDNFSHLKTLTDYTRYLFADKTNVNQTRNYRKNKRVVNSERESVNKNIKENVGTDSSSELEKEVLEIVDNILLKVRK